MSLSPLVTTAAETHRDLGLPAEAVGAITLAILLGLLAILLIFGGGREHS
jgi:hypothetical protein